MRDSAIARRARALMSVGGQAPSPPLQPPREAVRHGDLEVLNADLDRARMLGANAYRFSVEWARLEPSPGERRQEVLGGSYLKATKELKARGIERLRSST